jgi:hypothetical protein
MRKADLTGVGPDASIETLCRSRRGLAKARDDTMPDEPGRRAVRAHAPRMGLARFALEKEAGSSVECASPPVLLGNQALQHLALTRSIPPPALPRGIGNQAIQQLVRDWERLEPLAAHAAGLGNQAIQRATARALSGRSTSGEVRLPVIQRARREDLQPLQTVVFPDMVVLPGNWWIKPGTLARVLTVPASGDIVVRIESGAYAGSKVKIAPSYVEDADSQASALEHPKSERGLRREEPQQKPRNVENGSTVAPAIPVTPEKTTGTAPPWTSDRARESYRQTWVVGEVRYIFSSGHGYRPGHKKGGPDVTKVGAMNEIERAILADISSIMAGLAKGNGGERSVTVNGHSVNYRYRKIDDKGVGIGTYFLPG